VATASPGLMLRALPGDSFSICAFSVDRIRELNPSPRDLVPGLLLGCVTLVLLIFIDIFTNVWGYIAPVSTLFRNMFWLPFLLSAGADHPADLEREQDRSGSRPAWRRVSMGLEPSCWGLSSWAVRQAPADRTPAARRCGKTSLRVMTYNIQAANDGSGEQAYDRQLRAHPPGFA